MFLVTICGQKGYEINMEILVIFTGGTIGSKAQNGWISPNGDTSSLLLAKYRSVTGDNETNFTTLSPYTILSENLSADELNLLTDCIFKESKKDYDGIIVTHGTDTLQYSAAALSLMLGKVKMPILFVSAAYPLDDERTNGVLNFIGAVEFIKSKLKNGVFVSYKNENESKINIHTATRIIAHPEASSDVFSLDNNPYAFFEKGKMSLNPCYKTGVLSENIGKISFTKSPDILFIESRPGYGYEYLPDDCCAVIISPYHSGTLNTGSEKFKLFCKKAKERNIPVFVVNVPKGTAYESSSLFDELGLCVLPFCTKISIYVKCWIAQSANRDIKEFVLDHIAEEFIL